MLLKCDIALYFEMLYNNIIEIGRFLAFMKNIDYILSLFDLNQLNDNNIELLILIFEHLVNHIDD